MNITSKDDYEQIFARDNEYVGEASPGYIQSKRSLQAIKNHYPNSKFIISIREPFSWMKSQYYQQSRNGYEPEESFEAMYKKRLERDLEKDYDKGLLFPENLRYEIDYYESLKSFLDIFSEEQMHLVIFERFKQDNQMIVDEILEFLGLAPMDIQRERRNVAGLVRFRFVKDLLDSLRIPSFLDKDNITYKTLKKAYDCVFMTEPDEHISQNVIHKVRRDHLNEVRQLNNLLRKQYGFDVDLVDRWGYQQYENPSISSTC
jgi:hypothetical protein